MIITNNLLIFTEWSTPVAIFGAFLITIFGAYSITDYNFLALEQKDDTSLYKKSEAEVNMIGKVKIYSESLIMEDLRRLLVKK